MNTSSASYVEMNCIGDVADYVVYQSGGECCVWLVPGSEQERDSFGRKLEG